MGWLEKKAEKLVDKTIKKMMQGKKFLFMDNPLNYEEKERFIKFSKKVMIKAVHITTFISILIIMWYFYARLGVEKLTVLLLTLIFIQLIYMNKKWD